tara:strand:- start:1028 stop:1495 length:468 start_codon:yes stop_codon:yes gene_type:complete
MSDEIDNELDSLVNQLKQSNKETKEVIEQPETVNMTPEEIEQFVVQNSGKLITQSIGIIDDVKDYMVAAGDPDSLSSLSELIRASSTAIETMNKIAIQDKRTKTTLAAKQMDIQAKSIDVKPESDKLIGTREEMFKRLIKDAEVIEEPKNHQKDQ